MDLPIIMNRLNIFVCSLTTLLAFSFILFAIIHRRQCFNFPTLLSCNTALAVLIFGANNLAVSCYIFIWDQQQQPNVDFLCSIRAYIHHTALVCIHHSLVVQAIQKYCNVKSIKIFDSLSHKIYLVVIQWTLDLIFLLPVLFTGNMPKLSFDNMCLIALSKPYIIAITPIFSYILPDVILIVLYVTLVKFVRQASARVHTNQDIRMRRDLTMVRRIMMLNGQLIVLSLPVAIVIIMATIRLELLNVKYFRVLLLMMNTAPCILVTILFWITPNLRNCFYERFNCLTHGSAAIARLAQRHLPTTSNRVNPT